MPASAPPAESSCARLRVRALRSALAGPFSFELGAGRCLAICGASGAGKSLLLRMLCDLDTNEGEVLLDGVARADMRAPAWRARVVYQAAEPAWWAPNAAGHFKPEQMDRVRLLMPRLQLAPRLLDCDIAQLSTGERQRMALLRSLAGRPAVLLLDEPSAALDAQATAAMEQLLKDEMAGGLSIVLATHSEAQAQSLGQQRLWLHAGRLQEAPPPRAETAA